MYNFRYINPHCQFGATCYTMILSDSDMVLPDVRIDKTFYVDSSMIDSEFLYQSAQLDIQNVLAAQADGSFYATLAAPPDDGSDDEGDDDSGDGD